MKNCEPSWLNLQDYTGMHRQQNIKYWSHLHRCCSPKMVAYDKWNEVLGSFFYNNHIVWENFFVISTF